ncbi:MAG: response regulator [Chloroflexota bacterium]
MARQKHVVVVNDTEEILELFDHILTALGHKVTKLTYAPTDGREIAELKPDLCIIDFVLGGREFEGWQLIQKLRMMPATEDIPIIACTGAVREVREMEGKLAEKKVRILYKPFGASDLERQVKEALDD